MILKSWSSGARIFLPALLLGAGSLQAHEPAKAAPKSTVGVNIQAPDFALTDQENRPFVSTRLRGRVVVLNFIFTTCTDICPLFTANMVQLQRKLNGRFGGELFFVSITTDPEIDSPDVLKKYALRHGANLNNWAFLTGSETQLKNVWKSYSLQVIRKKRGLVQHSSLTTVIDRRGIRRFNHWGEKWKADELHREVLEVLEQKP